MLSQTEKGQAFAALHRAGIFIIPNPWDAGTARLLEHLGFKALATTSSGFAFAVGETDETIGRDETMAHSATLAKVSDLPVAIDLKNGFGDAPEFVAETIRLAAATGAVGGSIEDSTGSADAPLYDLALAVDRIRAAAEVAHRLPFPFTLCARAENFLVGNPELKPTIQRLQAYQEAGADLLYAPGLKTKDEIAAVVSSVDRPVNVLMGMRGMDLSVADLEALGVRRISVGSGLTRAALGAFVRASREMLDQGTFTFAEDAVPSLNSIFN